MPAVPKKFVRYKTFGRCVTTSAIEAGGAHRLTKLGVANGEGIAGSQAHREILDRFLLAVRMYGVKEPQKLRKRGAGLLFKWIRHA